LVSLAGSMPYDAIDEFSKCKLLVLYGWRTHEDSMYMKAALTPESLVDRLC